MESQEYDWVGQVIGRAAGQAGTTSTLPATSRLLDHRRYEFGVFANDRYYESSAIVPVRGGSDETQNVVRVFPSQVCYVDRDDRGDSEKRIRPGVRTWRDERR